MKLSETVAFVVRNVNSAECVLDGNDYVGHTLCHPRKLFDTYAEASKVARRMGWGWIVERVTVLR